MPPQPPPAAAASSHTRFGFPRMKLINVVTVFFLVCPLVFYVLAQLDVPLGMIFFVWIGIFNLMIVAQFWSLANDIYSKEEGERLLVIVGLGASLGAVAGAAPGRSSDRALRRPPVDAARRRRARHPARAHQLHRPDGARPPPAGPTKVNAARAEQRLRHGVPDAVPAADGPDADDGELDQYDREYILGSIVKDNAAATIAAGRAGGLTEGQIIGNFYAKYFSLVNALGLFLQLFVVSRIIKHRGVAFAVMVLPALSFGVYNVLIFVPFSTRCWRPKFSRIRPTTR